MLRYLTYRVASILPVLLGVSIVVFFMMKLIPGDPVEAILGPAATTDKIEMVRRSLGLDRPFYVQYFRWLGKVLQGDFGVSIAVNVPVAQLVWPKFWNTVLLTAVTTASVSAAIIARLVRSSFLDVIRKHYVTALRAKGLSERAIVFRHALKNALPPIINIVGLQIGYLMGGALFTEVVFSWPGIGLQIYSSIVAPDLPVVQAAVLVTTFVFVLVNLGTDIVVAALDPRIRRG